MHRKSSGHKVLAVGAAEGARAGLSLPNERLPENIEALIPMISSHYIDTKVRKTIACNESSQEEECFSHLGFF